MRTIVLTAGHGGKDPGAVNGSVTEAALMVRLRNATAYYLRATGYEVVSDGNGYENKTLQEAMRLIPQGAIAVELHTNASTDKKAKGVEVVAKASNKVMAQKLAAAIAPVLGIPIRRDGGWYDYKLRPGTLGYIEAGGLIVETFFISNDSELKTFDEKFWLVAKAIAAAIHENCAACRA